MLFSRPPHQLLLILLSMNIPPPPHLVQVRMMMKPETACYTFLVLCTVYMYPVLVAPLRILNHLDNFPAFFFLFCLGTTFFT
jgi:hypothetical protein